VTWLQLIDCAMALSLAGAIGYRIGHRRGVDKAERDQIVRLRDAALEACIANHPAGGSKPHLRVVQK
jgi:hypothetical protein